MLVVRRPEDDVDSIVAVEFDQIVVQAIRIVSIDYENYRVVCGCLYHEPMLVEQIALQVVPMNYLERCVSGVVSL